MSLLLRSSLSGMLESRVNGLNHDLFSVSFHSSLPRSWVAVMIRTLFFAGPSVISIVN